MVENEKIKISFDFDYTLEFKHIREYAKELIVRGYDVWIVTSRYSDEKLEECNWIEGNNDILWEAVDELNLPKDKVVFTNYQDKWNYFQNEKFLFHLDDEETELIYINTKTDVIGIGCYENNTWKKECEEILKKFG
jgi:hypothetical protein